MNARAAIKNISRMSLFIALSRSAIEKISRCRERLNPCMDTSHQNSSLSTLRQNIPLGKVCIRYTQQPLSFQN